MISCSSEALLETLMLRGWRFRDPDEMISLIQSKKLSSSSSSLLVDSIESELLNMDLRFFGGKSLPEPSPSKKSFYLHGPKVLQLVSVRDICQSVIDSSFRSWQHQPRLLRFVLTDGQSEIVGIEYSPILTITEEIIPGCKVRLENKIAMHYGILCLNTEALTIMGGIVQSLYEEWQMSQRYSGFSRSLTRLPQNDDGGGPPPFEKLQTQACPRKVSQYSSSHVGHNEGYQRGNKDQHTHGVGKDQASDDPKLVSSAIESEEKSSNTEARPKEAIEAVPVQNQAAAQKLLQKMIQPMNEGRKPRDHKPRFKGKQEEAPVFTLDEWERKKASSSNAIGMANIQNNISGDEELARQLQSQLDMEDYQHNLSSNHRVMAGNEADQIRMSMFNFGGTEDMRNDGRGDFRGRGRGRGRGRERGRKRFG